MNSFQWHLMAVERPESGKGSYVIMGHKGAMYYANEFDAYSANSQHHRFYVPNNRNPYFDTEMVMAWAEVPPFEEYETERVRCVGRCAECDHYYHNNSFCNPSWCEWWGDETEDDGFCHYFKPREEVPDGDNA